MKFIKSFGQYSLNENNADIDYSKVLAKAKFDGKYNRFQLYYNGVKLVDADKKDTWNVSGDADLTNRVYYADANTVLKMPRLVIKFGNDKKALKNGIEIPYNSMAADANQSFGLAVVGALSSRPAASISNPTPVPPPSKTTFDFAGGFELSKWDMQSDLIQALDNAIKSLDKNVKLHVDGYASVDGSPESDLKLSTNRANAVMEYLKTKGFQNVTAKGHGQTTKFSKDKPEDNRRIVVTTL
jgi:outer membrane protein OmpA-like peptidoglycan-associated protein